MSRATLSSAVSFSQQLQFSGLPSLSPKRYRHWIHFANAGRTAFFSGEFCKRSAPTGADSWTRLAFTGVPSRGWRRRVHLHGLHFRSRLRPASCYWSRVAASMTASTRRRRFPSCIEPPCSRSSCCAPQLEHPCRLQSHGRDVVGRV